MTINEIIGREPAFPISRIMYGGDDYSDHQEEQRILMGHYDANTGAIDQEKLKGVTELDVVYIPLYGGKLVVGRLLADSVKQKGAHYGENVEWIKEHAGEVRGILVGNAGPELSFKHIWLNNTKQHRRVLSELMCELAAETSEIIFSAGGLDVYGTIDWDMAVDFYYAGNMFRDFCNETGAIQLCFCGYQLFGLATEGPWPRIPHPDSKWFWPLCPVDDPLPRPELQEYIRGGTFWTGCHGLGGMRENLDYALRDIGFAEGVLLPRELYPEL